MKAFILTFDVEEFLIEDFKFRNKNEMFELSEKGLERIIKLLKKYNIKSTFFITLKFAEKCPKIIRKLIKEGHEIGLHAYEHSHNYTLMNQKDAYKFILDAKRILEKRFNIKIDGFRAPQMKRPSYNVLRKSGFSYDSSSHPTYILGYHNDFFGSRKIRKRDDIIVVPVSVVPLIKLPLSWIWFRNFPLFYTKLGTNLSLMNTDYINLYFHPWEFVDVDNKSYKKKTTNLIVRKTGDYNLKKLEKYIIWCNKRGFIFNTIRNFLSLYKIDRIRNRFDFIAEDYAKNRERGVMGLLFRKEKEKILEILNVRKNERILDAGCGPGTYSLSIKKLGGIPYGIDISERMVEEARKNNIKVEVADIQTYKSKMKFDKILVGSAMEFVPSLEETIKNLKNNLKKGGYLVFDMPRFSILGLLYYLYYKYKGININIISRRRLRSILSESGFKLDKIENAGSLMLGVKARIHN